MWDATPNGVAGQAGRSGSTDLGQPANSGRAALCAAAPDADGSSQSGEAIAPRSYGCAAAMDARLASAYDAVRTGLRGAAPFQGRSDHEIR